MNSISEQKDVRRRRLALLVDEVGQGKLAALTGIPEARLYQMSKARGKSKRPVSDANARLIESRSGKQHGWLDDDDELRANQDRGSGSGRELPSDSLRVREFDVVASMGGGAIVEDHPQVVQSITVSLSELKKQASFSSPPNLSFITGRGDSMLPTFNDGDMLLVDQNVTEHKIDAVFAFTYDGEFYVKTLQRVPGRGVMAVSHNRTVYEPFRIEPDKPFTIHGRVVLAWNARKL